MDEKTDQSEKSEEKALTDKELFLSIIPFIKKKLKKLDDGFAVLHVSSGWKVIMVILGWANFLTISLFLSFFLINLPTWLMRTYDGGGLGWGLLLILIFTTPLIILAIPLIISILLVMFLNIPIFLLFIKKYHPPKRIRNLLIVLILFSIFLLWSVTGTV